MRTFFTILNILYFCLMSYLCVDNIKFVMPIGFTLGMFYSKLEEINDNLKK